MHRSIIEVDSIYRGPGKSEFWDFSSQKSWEKMPTWRTINSWVHIIIRIHGRRGKGMAESFSREKLRQAPQKEGGQILCDLAV